MNPVRILLIEDSPSDALLIESLLSGEKSFDGTLARAGRLADGLALLVGEPFDVVLSDLSLPDSEGLATFEALYQQAPRLPIIVLTRQDDMDTALAAIQGGAQDFLPKTELSGLLLARTIRHAIERKNLVVELQTALGEVKTLSGLLPICATCKKVRDDQGYWNQIEAYIKQHSDASFTHGFCPECAVKFFEDSGMPVPDEILAAAKKHEHHGLR